jgi:tetratricopeptide (TPR) repeat protein
VRTDLPKDDAESAIRAFERDYDALAQVAFSFKERPAPRAEVVLFRSALERASFISHAGVFREGFPGFGRPPTMITSGSLDPESHLTFRHELTHRFVRRYYRQAPVWFNEGLAQYYSTLEIKEHEVKVGLPFPWRGFMRRGAEVPVSDLLEGGRRFFYAKRTEVEHHAAAWGLVHMLISEPDRYRPSFGDLMVAMSQGESFQTAFRKAYPDVDRSRLAEDFRAYIERDSTYAYRIAMDPSPIGPVTAREMSDAEVHVLWAMTRQWMDPQARARAGRDLEEALRAAPTSSLALALHGSWLETEGGGTEARNELERSGLAAPLALFLLRHHAAQEAAALLPRLTVLESAEALEIAARIQLALDRPTEALTLARRSIDVEPSSVSCLELVAELEWIAGDHESAIEAMSLAIELSPEELDVTLLAARLEAWRAQTRQAE